MSDGGSEGASRIDIAGLLFGLIFSFVAIGYMTRGLAGIVGGLLLMLSGWLMMPVTRPVVLGTFGAISSLLDGPDILNIGRSVLVSVIVISAISGIIIAPAASSPDPSNTGAPTPTPSPISEATLTPTPTESPIDSPTETPVPTETQTSTVTPTPTATPTPEPTPTETPIPTSTPEPEPGELVVYSVHADADGYDHDNLNDEYIVFRNGGDSELDLGGWTISDAADHTYTIPSGFTLEADATVTVHTGSGSDSDSDIYWGSSSAVWNNGGDTIIVTTDSGETVIDYEY